MRAEIPVRIRSADPAHPFDILTRTLIVNAQGCGLHTPNDLPIGVPVELAIEDRVVSGRILNSTAVDAERGAWVAGIQLDKPGNVWGLPSPPADWAAITQSAAVAIHPFTRSAASRPVAASTAPTLVAAPSGRGPAATPSAATDTADTKKKLEVLADEIAGQLRTRASADWEIWRAQAEASLRQLQQELANDLSGRIGKRHAELQKAIENLSQMVSLAEQRRNELASAAAAPAIDAKAGAESLRTTAEQISAQWLRDSERVMGGLRTRVEELVARQEAEVAARLSQRQNDIIKSVETGSGKLDRLLAAADRALEQMEGWEKRSATVNADLLRAAEAALENIDARRAAAESSLQQSTAASLEKLNAAVADGERKLDAKVQQHSWDYDAQAEAAGQKLESQLSDAINKLRMTLEQHESTLAGAAESQRQGLSAGLSEQIQAETERHFATFRADREQPAGTLHPAVEADARKREAELQAGHQKLAAGMADLAARQEQIAAQIAELQKTKAEIESITTSLPATIVAQAERQAAVAWEQLRNDSQKMIAEAVGAETKRNLASLSDDVAAQARLLREHLADEAGHMAAEFQQKIAASLAERQQLIGREVQAAVEQASREFTQRAQSQAEAHQSAAAAVHDSAQRRLEEIARRSEHLLAESEAALYKSVDEIISGELARAQREIQDGATLQVEDVFANLRSEAARIAGEHTAATENLRAVQAAAAAEAAALEKQAQLARETRDQLAAAAGEFSEQARAEAERHRVGAEAAYEAARRRLDEILQRSEHLLGETEAALQRSVDEVVAAEVARAQEQVRQFAGPHVESALAGLRADAAKLTGSHTAAANAAADRAEQIAGRLSSLHESAAQTTEALAARQAQLARHMQEEVAKVAGEFSRHAQAESQRYSSEAAARLQQLQAAGELQTEALRKQLEQAQAWLSERTAEFQQSVHDAFLQAAGEIRGRVHSAVDTVDELIQLKSKDVIAGMDSIGARHAETLARSADEVRRTVEAARANAAATAEAELQNKLAQTLEQFRDDAARLAHSAASRWQDAMEETLRSFPELLRARLAPEKPAQE